MIFYASGAIVDSPTIDLVIDRRIALLTSYAYKGAMRKQLPYLARRLREQHLRMPYMVDSGAFTAWNKGKEVRRESLIRFYNTVQEQYCDVLDFTFVSLDKIPGRQGVARTAEDYRIAAEVTVQNFHAMRKEVTGYIKPVYHDGEPEWVLNEYRDTKYISLSANQDLAYWQREEWVRQMADRLASRHTFHGLAMTGSTMLRTISWHSVDSAAWRLWAAMGAIAWLRDNGTLKILACSKESPRGKKHQQHLSTLSPIERDAVVAQLEQEELTLDMVRDDSMARSRFNILIFNRACNHAQTAGVLKTRFLSAEKGLFDA
jgi:hypothetical protein